LCFSACRFGWNFFPEFLGFFFGDCVKKFSAFFCFLLLASFANAAELYYLLSVGESFSTVPATPFPGDIVSLVVGVENLASTSTAYDVNTYLQLNQQIFENIDVVENLGEIRSRSTKQAAFQFKILDEAIPGLYRIPLRFDYVNGSTVVTDYFDVNILVNECFELDVDDVSYLPEKVYAGENIVLSGTVLNACSGVARSVSVELNPVTNASFDPFVLLSSNVVELGNILPRESENFSFVLNPVSNATPQVYVFELSAACLDCAEATTDKASFEVLGRPWVIVSGTDFSIAARKDSKDLQQGDIFSFSVQLDNIGKEKARAVKVFLVTDASFTGSKESFVGNVDPDDSGSAIFDLIVTPNASVGQHNSTIAIEFVDETGLVQSVEESYEFFVSQRPGESPVFLLVLIIVFLVVLYFVLKLVFRQLALRKANLK